MARAGGAVCGRRPRRALPGGEAGEWRWPRGAVAEAPPRPEADLPGTCRGSRSPAGQPLSPSSGRGGSGQQVACRGHRLHPPRPSPRRPWLWGGTCRKPCRPRPGETRTAHRTRRLPQQHSQGAPSSPRAALGACGVGAPRTGLTSSWHRLYPDSGGEHLHPGFRPPPVLQEVDCPGGPGGTGHLRAAGGRSGLGWPPCAPCRPWEGRAGPVGPRPPWWPPLAHGGACPAPCSLGAWRPGRALRGGAPRPASANSVSLLPAPTASPRRSSFRSWG